MPLLKPLIVERDEYIVREGETGDEMFFVTGGQVEVLSGSGDEVYATRYEGDFFGEVACMQLRGSDGGAEEGGHRRIASVRAACRSQLWSLSRRDLLGVLRRFPDVEACLLRAGVRRVQHTSALLACRLGTLFGDVEMPDSLRGAFFAQVAPLMQPRAAPAGTYIIREGDESDDTLFFLLQGQVEVVTEASGKPKVLARRVPVAFFGEVAALGLGAYRGGDEHASTVGLRALR